MSDTSTAPATGSIAEAAQAFEQILSGDDQDTGDTIKAQSSEEADETEEAADEAAEEGSEESEEEGSEEEADESAEDEDESEEAEAEDEEAAEPVYTVKVDGQEYEVPASELVKGYQRNADYTRKTQELAEARRQVATEAQQSAALREQYAQRLAQVEQVLQQSQPAEPNWDHLRATDPIEFAAQWAEHQRRQQVMAQVQAERLAIEQQRAQEHARETEAQLGQARQYLLQAIPEWANPEVAKAERARLKETGRKYGYSDEELSQVTDPRAVILLRMAMKYDEAMAKRSTVKPAPKKAATPALKPGVPASKVSKKVSDLTRSKMRLAQTGTVRDAAEVFRHLI